ncbi:lipoprotein insertase outer membrane protein LolB [Aestuariibacter sp. AA17]|uniref:Outer-membrane lipoprotein LolB n=1 Tax=Fluctibacter corallii TaxID=2984329 RepID=A0ABT3ADL8_9ALTE|nr:lipoprotein insertase outer membrane protein LolB [Aestuariibacter sp. AA17]MCV2886667.1 lipoprotein insertase outer membrane protein LolB [Aestuariibacter sp. AA17]
MKLLRIRIFYLFSFVFVLVLTGCATKPQAPISLNASAHQAQLANIHQWSIKGRMAFKSTEDKFSANLNWVQNTQEYDVKFTTFIGTHLMSMRSTDEFAEMQIDDQYYVDANAETLIQRTTGWHIPLSHLPQWIKGQFTENATYRFDERGLLQSLSPHCTSCGEWQITFGQYQKINHVWLPHQLVLTNPLEHNTQIKIRIHTWQLL